MMELKNVFYVIGIICLTFLGIPIRIRKQSISPEEDTFNKYIIQFNKTYQNNLTEYHTRFKHFQESLKAIEDLNKNRTRGGALYGLTKYSDLSRQEFREKHLQQNISYNENFAQPGKRRKRAIVNLPNGIDWRDKGIINTVRNQNTCGACWAFSVISTVESMNALKTGSLKTFSVQEVIDCAKNGNYGCEGGDACTLLQWLTTSKTKIEEEKMYPFTHVTQSCKLKGSEDGIQVKTYLCENLVNSEDSILARLATHGPVAVAVNAINWQYYLGGTIQFHCSGSPTMLNHAVQLVGYDRLAPVPHYIARNSWGTEFGDNGYLYLAIGSNICGLANEVTSLDV